MEEDRRRIGIDWRGIGGGLEEDWGRIFIDCRSSDGCRWIVFGLVTPQDGLVTPPLWGLCADLPEKRPKYVKIIEFHRFSFMRCSKWLQIVKNHVLRFLPFYPLILALQALSCLQAIDLEKIYRLVSKILNFMACGSVLGRFCVSCKNFVGSASKIY